MKLSEAMLAGMKHPRFKYQCKRSLTDSKGGFCALGAARLGVGIPDGSFRSVADETNTPYFDITTMNDSWKWGIKRIAKWLSKRGY